jgi:hypothetical protein
LEQKDYGKSALPKLNTVLRSSDWKKTSLLKIENNAPWHKRCAATVTTGEAILPE